MLDVSKPSNFVRRVASRVGRGDSAAPSRHEQYNAVAILKNAHLVAMGGGELNSTLRGDSD